MTCRHIKRITPVFVIALILSALFMCISVSAAERSVIDSVTIIREKDSCRLDISAKIITSDMAVVSGEDLYLFELAPWQSTSRLAEQAPIDSAKAASSMNFTLTFGNDTMRIYSKFLLARKLPDGKYSIVTTAHYVDNPEVIAPETYGYPEYASKKGLAVQLYTDAQELGVAHTVINVPVNEYIQTAKLTDSLQYTYCGGTYYVNRDKLNYLDSRIKELTDSGCHCYLNFILTPPTEQLSDGLACMYFTEDTSNGSALYALNTTEKNSVQYFAAFANFLAKRYTASSGTYGFAGSFIIGYEINSNRSYNYMGAHSLDTYMNYYTVAFRIADTALRSAYSNGRTYISLAGNWNTIAMDSTATLFDENLDYSAKDTLNVFADKISLAGDIPWNVAINARTSDVLSTDYTSDMLAPRSADTAYISMNNLNVFTDYMDSEAMLYKGNKRRITVQSFCINSGEDEESEELQAAMYALAYYRTFFNPDIEACIYYRHVDNVNERGNFGLWKADKDTALFPTVTKPIYSVFKYIDTVDAANTVSKYLSLLGADSLGSFIEGFNADLPITRRVIKGKSELEKSNAVDDDSIVFDFTGGSMCGFTPDDNCEYMELRENDKGDGYLLYVQGHYEYPNEYMGIGITFDEPMNIKKAGSMTVSLMAASDAGNGKVDVVVRFCSLDTGKCTSFYEGRYEGLNVEALSAITFDLSGIASAAETVDVMKIWIRPTSETDGSQYGFYLRDISMQGSHKFDFMKIVEIFFIALISAVIICVIIIVAMRIVNKSRGKKRRARRRRMVRR